MCALIGLMPRFMWIILAEVLYFLLYKVVKYRVKVTRRNLLNSFPQKSTKELRGIERHFYRYLSDIFIETLAMAGVTKRRMRRLMTFITDEDFKSDAATKSVIVAMAHYGSWEWPSIYAEHISGRLVPVYHTLANGTADKLFLKLRRRFGAEPVSMRLVGRRLVELKDERIMLALIADQTPPTLAKSEWMTFLNQDTQFFGGIEQLSLKYKMPVYFFDVKRPKRNHYVGQLVKLYDGVSDIEQHEITRRYKEYLEKKIVETPHLWVWSHNRWKHKKR